jgi:peptidoglycan/LPS O-acetylase OafA/YrhL
VTTKREFLNYLEWFRAIAIFMVLLSHIPVGYHDDPWLTGVQIFFTNGTFFFVLIAGFLMHYLGEVQAGYGRYLIKKLRFVASPYFVMMTLVMGYFVLFDQEITLPWYIKEGYEGKSLVYEIVFYLYIGWEQLWFIPMIFIFFLTAPMTLALAKWRWSWLILLLGLTLALMTYRPYGNANPLLSFAHFFGVFFLGIYLSSQRHWLNPWLKQQTWLLILLGIATLFSFALAYQDDNCCSFETLGIVGCDLLNKQMLFKLILGSLIYVVLLRWANQRQPLITLIANYSFGLFFLHFFVLIWLANLGLPEVNELSGFFAHAVLLIVTTMLCVWLVKRVSGKYSRYLIGS